MHKRDNCELHVTYIRYRVEITKISKVNTRLVGLDKQTDADELFAVRFTRPQAKYLTTIWRHNALRVSIS